MSNGVVWFQVVGSSGTTVVPPTAIPEYDLTFAYFTDPQGNLIGLSRGAAQ